MGARSHIVRWGSSLAIRIPKLVAEQWGVCEGSSIDMVLRGDQLVMSKRAYDLTEMLARTSPETLQGEIDTGPAQGREEWARPSRTITRRRSPSDPRELPARSHRPGS